MNKPESVSIRVPATTANLVAGFDCIGVALSLYNQFQFTASDSATTITVEGVESGTISLEEDNLLYRSFSHLYQHIGKKVPAVNIRVKVNVPLARGLGSSATAIVGGLLAANHFASYPLSPEQLLDLAIEIEGHPDNVAPAMLGGCILSVGDRGNRHFVPIDCHETIRFVVAIPDFELSTSQARAVLPQFLSYEQAVFNIAHLGLLVKALETGKPEWLKEALKDKLHQPYRQSLIRGYERVYEAVLGAGGHGMVISGAGPTLLALCSPGCVSEVMRAMGESWGEEGVRATVRCLEVDREGAKVIVP